MKRENVKTNNTRRIQRNENSPKEVTEILRIKKKYSFKHIMFCKLFEVHLVFLLVIAYFILDKRIASFLLSILLYLSIIIIALILYKKSAENTYVSFQEHKAVYRRRFLFINKREEMLYRDIKEITFQYEIGAWNKFWQKRTNLGNMTIQPKKGNAFIYGIEISNIGPFDKAMVDVKNEIGDKLR